MCLVYRRHGGAFDEGQILTLRGYRRADVERMHALDVLCFEPLFRFSRSAMRRFAEAVNARVVIAERDGEMVGFCILHLEGEAAGLVGYIVTIDVDPARRREGIAEALMQEAEALARAGGCVAMGLHVHTGNVAAIWFYQALGFERVGLEADFYGRGVDAQMWRKLLVGTAE